jgi:heme-degrading monooxygenase HmoA
MNARLTIFRVQPGKTDEALKIFRESITPAAKIQKGFRKVYLFTKPNSDQVVWLTFWATEADLKTAETNGFFKEQIGKTKDVTIGPPITDVYEIAVEDKSPRFQFARPRSRAPKASES